MRPVDSWAACKPFTDALSDMTKHLIKSPKLVGLDHGTLRCMAFKTWNFFAPDIVPFMFLVPFLQGGPNLPSLPPANDAQDEPKPAPKQEPKSQQKHKQQAKEKQQAEQPKQEPELEEAALLTSEASAEQRQQQVVNWKLQCKCDVGCACAHVMREYARMLRVHDAHMHVMAQSVMAQQRSPSALNTRQCILKACEELSTRCSLQGGDPWHIAVQLGNNLICSPTFVRVLTALLTLQVYKSKQELAQATSQAASQASATFKQQLSDVLKKCAALPSGKQNREGAADGSNMQGAGGEGAAAGGSGNGEGDGQAQNQELVEKAGPNQDGAEATTQGTKPAGSTPDGQDGDVHMGGDASP
eukprot:1156712-Pelagomonas_calceolata.AAC.10